MYLLDNSTSCLVEAEIILASLKDIPSEKGGWKFNWKTVFQDKETQTYVIRLKNASFTIQGILGLKKVNEMLIMDLVEIAPHNIGSERKRYKHVAGCLIAFACRESFKLLNNYNGFLIFESKTNLISWYETNYNAKLISGQRMCIEPNAGKALIEKYL